MNSKHPNLKYTVMSVASVAAFLLIWFFVTDVLHLTKPTTLPSPAVVFKTFIYKLNHTDPDGATMIQHTLSSLRVALSGYLLGAVVGIPLGILMAWYKPVDRFARPLFDLLRPVPGIAWIPLMIVLFGIGLLSKAMVIFLTVLVPCVLNAYTGIRQTRDVHLWVGQTFGATNWQMLTRIAMPTSLPMIMTGLRVALGSAWMALVAAELLASTRGLGFMIQQARGIFRPDIIIAGMAAIGMVGAALTFVLGKIEQHVVKGVKR